MTSPSRLSSYSSSVRARLKGRGTLVTLWGLVAALCVVLIFVMRPHHGPRDDVTAYIGEVNSVSTTFTQDYRVIENAYRTFVLAPKHPAPQEARLREASRDLTTLRVRMERIAAPPHARELKRRLVAYFRAQEAVSHELLGVSGYVPQLTVAERPLGPASARMRAVLKHGGKATVQAAALSAYAAVLTRTAESVAAIPAPQLFRTSQGAQVTRLQRSATLMNQLAGALDANDRALVQKTVRELGASNGSSNAARVAILAYNRRVVRIRELAARVEQERRKLDSDL